MDKNEMIQRLYELSNKALEGRDECWITNRHSEMQWWMDVFTQLHRTLVQAKGYPDCLRDMK